jgi:hypothetical protein
MNLQDLGSLGEFVGSIAVVLSLLYLAVQIRQNTATERTSSRQTILDTFYTALWDLGASPERKRVLTAGLANFEALSDQDKATFQLTMIRYLGNVYNGLLLRDAGMLDEETFSVIADTMLATLITTGGRQWWAASQDGSPPTIRDYIDRRLSDTDNLPPSLTDSSPWWRSM